MSKRKNCTNGHRFQEHGIGAGLTRKVCAICGQIEIGHGIRTVLIDKPMADGPPPLFAKAT